MFFSFFFFNDTATTEIYTLSLHDALPISENCRWRAACGERSFREGGPVEIAQYRYSSGRGERRELCRGIRGNSVRRQDRKSTRLNSSHGYISYAVFCLKKKNNDIC